MRGLGDVRITSFAFAFVDKLADQHVPYLFARGTWRGGDLANKINTVELTCTPGESRCDLSQANVMALSGGQPALSMYNKSFRITKLDTQTVVAEPNLRDLCVSPNADVRPRSKGSDFGAHKFGDGGANDQRIVLGPARKVGPFSSSRMRAAF